MNAPFHQNNNAEKVRKVTLAIQKEYLDSLKDTIFSHVSDDRGKHIYTKRYNLDLEGFCTLQEIGTTMNISRERVRQILSRNRNKFIESRDFDKMVPLRESFLIILTEFYGILESEDFFQKFVYALDCGKEEREYYVNLSKFFFSFLEDTFNVLEESERMVRSIYLSEENLEKAREIIILSMKYLKKAKKPEKVSLVFSKVFEWFQRNKKKFIDIPQFRELLRLSKSVHVTKFDQLVLTEWSYGKVKTMKDIAIIILENEGKPLHFTELWKRIQRYVGEKNKKLSVHSVHNELIRDERFVLVGRGLYGLTKWNYFNGTVSEMIENIIRKNDGEASREFIFEEVLKRKIVKPDTISSNLQNKKIFHREGDIYRLVVFKDRVKQRAFAKEGV